LVNTVETQAAARGIKVSYHYPSRCSILDRRSILLFPTAGWGVYNGAFFRNSYNSFSGGLRMITQNSRTTAIFLTVLLATGVAFAKSTTTTHKASPHSANAHKTWSNSTKHSSKTKRAGAKQRGQRTIGQERTREIQSALIREHYLSGEPSGVWDQQSKDAMMRFQAANGWQTKTVPDSRALIKLGLGPDHKGLLNPDTAVVASPHQLGAGHETVPGGSSQP
jgi:hypothetical protein